MLKGNKTTTVTNILETARQQLTQAGCDTPQLDAEVLLAHTLNRERTWLYLYPGAALNQQQADDFWQLVQRRAAREPVAYLTGGKAFFGLDFLVNRHVLIPRPETELLIETILLNQALRINHKLFIVDIGTGSGCIAITLAKHLSQACIIAADISGQALALARQNAACHRVSEKVHFVLSDLLAPFSGPFDLIVSNPPYLKQEELAAGDMMPEVTRYEPRLALDGGQDGLAVIKKLLVQAKAKLKPNGYLLLEIGSGQGEAVKKMAQICFPEANIEIKKDLAGLDRLLVVQNNQEN